MTPFQRALLLLLLPAPLCIAAQLILPSGALERNQPVTAIYKTGLQATGKGQLQIDWKDAYGRTVDNRTLPVELTDENEFRFQLDLRRAVAMRNEVRVHFSFDGQNKKGEKDHREEDARAAFIASPPDQGWWDYMIMMWQEGSAAQFKQLQEVGVNAGKSSEHSMDLPDFLLENDMPWYVENMATDFYSSYHIYRPDRPYNAELLKAKDLYKRDPSSKDAFKREPSFSDPAWLSKIRDRLVESAKKYSPYRPIFYNLADEAGIAELAGFWDFDFSDYSLGAMRTWLRAHHGTLSKLNAEWGSAFLNWNEVTPATTREAMKRTDGNYSSWADHKEWMDISFATALKMGVDAVHSVDPRAYVGIEGAQMPGWGGYDYYRLSSVLDAMEPYDIGDNIEITRSFHPNLAFVTTAFATGPWEKHRLWFELLHGARGHIIWDEKHEIVQPNGSIGPRGKEVSPYWNELRDGMGALFINSTRQSGPIAIHYSQASMRTDWMLTQRPKGDAWVDRMSWTERKDSDFLRLRDSYCRLIEDQGLQYNFVSYEQVEQSELLKGGYRVLILPSSNSLSALEADAITNFVQQGGLLIVDGDTGTYDEHSRRLPESSLAGLLNGRTGQGKVIRLSALNYHQQRVVGKGAELQKAMGEILAKAGVRPHYAVVDTAGHPVLGVETHEFRNEATTIIGLISNPPVDVDELGPPEFRSNQPFEKPRQVRLLLPPDLPGGLYAYDLRHAKSLGKVKELTLTVDPYEPSLIAFSPAAFPELLISTPQKIARGETAHIGLSFAAPTSASTHVFHIDVLGPEGERVGYYSGNLLARAGTTEKVLPLAMDEKVGRWTVKVKDLLSGQERSSHFEVF